jgi:acyl-coenzyme A thioesterase 13
MNAPLPAGFVGSTRTSPLLDLVGPIAVAERDGATVIGMWAEERHTNSRGAVHGAVLSALADIAMGRNAATASTPRSMLVTVTLSIDFITAARVGQWLEASATVQRTGRRLAFAQGRIHADSILVAQTSGTFAVVSERAPKSA